MFVLLLIWVFAGIYTGPGVYLIITASLFLLFANERFPEIFIGFLLIVILSDSLEDQMNFAKTFKNIYILMLFFFFIVSINKQEFLIEIYKYFIPYFILALIGLFYSPIFFISFQKLLSYILLFIVVPNYILRSYQIQGAYFFRNLIFFLFAIIVTGFLIRYYNFEIAYSHGGRHRGLFGNPNGLGIYMILFFIIFTIINHKFPELFSRIEIIILSFIMFYILYMTGSRTALIAVLLFYGFNQVFKYSTFLGFFLFLILMISMEFIIIYLPQIIIFLGLEKSFRLETLQQGSGRIIAWEFAWRNIQESFFIGKGIGFDEHLMRENRDFLSKAGHEGGVHNTYLIVWLNTGLIGLLTFLRGIFLVFIKGAKNNTYAFPALFAIMLSINFEPWLAASLNPFTSMFLIIVTLLTAPVFNEELNEENEIELEEETEMV